MNGKHYVGKKAQSFEQYEDVVVEGVLVQNNEGTQFKAGNQDGYVLSINCPYASQEMADDLFAKLGNKVYRGYRADKAVLDPQAELGDGITINGIYSMLAYRRVNFGPGHASEIAAPGESTLNHEYNYVSPTRREIEKNKGDLDEFVKNFTEYLELLKQQTDQKAETWYQEDDPSAGWDEKEKAEHSGDIWYNTSDGNFYIYDGTEWRQSPTTPPDYVFDQIDKKAEIYVTQPVPPYNEHDLWFGGENEPIRVCVQSREEGEEFHMEDWEKKDEYIDKSDAEQAGKDAVDRQTQDDIFNKLTNGGTAQGIFKDENGDIYVNAQYLRGDTIDLNILRLLGSVGGIMQGYGATKDEQTEGIVIYANGVDSQGNANPPYLITTDGGIRGQTGTDYNFNMFGGAFEVLGDITATKAGSASGNIYIGNKNPSGTSRLATYGADGNMRGLVTRAGAMQPLPVVYFGNTSDNTYLQGAAIRWNVQPALDSDRTLKKNIEALPGAYEKLLDGMKPVRFRYKREPDDGPFHMGYIAQDVEEAMKDAGLSRADLAALSEFPQEDGEIKLGLAYEEFIALLHMKIHNLEERVGKLEGQVTSNG